MSDFKKLVVWQKAHALAVDGIKTAVRIRAKHFSSIKSQTVRAASSVPTNIVEGSGQDSRKEFCRFLRYSLNSAYELEYHWILARDIEIITLEDFERLNDKTTEVQRMLRGLIKRVRRFEQEDERAREEPR